MLLDTGNNWYAGNCKNGEGEYSVKEGFVELDLPLFDSESAGRANLNAASRLTDFTGVKGIDPSGSNMRRARLHCGRSNQLE